MSYQKNRKKAALKRTIGYAVGSLAVSWLLVAFLQSLDLINENVVKTLDYTGPILTMSGLMLAVKTLVLGMQDHFVPKDQSGPPGRYYSETLHQATYTTYLLIALGGLSFLIRILDVDAAFGADSSQSIRVYFVALVLPVFILTLAVAFQFTRLITMRLDDRSN